MGNVFRKGRIWNHWWVTKFISVTFLEMSEFQSIFVAPLCQVVLSDIC